MARMSRFSKIGPPCFFVLRTATFTMALGQVVGPNHLVGEKHPKRRIDPKQQAVAEIGFLPRLHGIDVRGSEDVDGRKARAKTSTRREMLLA
jgi:hypothetical protein